uniref:Exportin-1/Importin-beta-like domain-containing protein n=1 Tax=Spongospora subterranea TaxID=70186 RepID=A0A0H5QK01_9EUKA|eukprot:CRZ02308.1 hypothetical protein [Spongospora subterranea]
MEDVCRAMAIMSAGISASPADVNAANTFLITFAHSSEAWAVCTGILSSPTLPSNIRFMATHMLHAKIEAQYDSLVGDETQALQDALLTALHAGILNASDNHICHRLAQCIVKIALEQSLSEFAVKCIRSVSPTAPAWLLLLSAAMETASSTNRLSFSNKQQFGSLLSKHLPSIIVAIEQSIIVDATMPMGLPSEAALFCILQLQSHQVALNSLFQLKAACLVDPLLGIFQLWRSSIVLEIFINCLCGESNGVNIGTCIEFMSSSGSLFQSVIDGPDSNDVKFAVTRLAVSMPCTVLFGHESPVSLQWVHWIMTLTSHSLPNAILCIEFWLNVLQMPLESRISAWSDNAVFYRLCDVLFQHCLIHDEDDDEIAEQRMEFLLQCEDCWISLYYCLGVDLIKTRFYNAIVAPATWQVADAACHTLKLLAPIVFDENHADDNLELFVSLVRFIVPYLSVSNDKLLCSATSALGNFAFIIVRSEEILQETLAALLTAIGHVPSSDCVVAISKSLRNIINQSPPQALVSFSEQFLPLSDRIISSTQFLLSSTLLHTPSVRKIAASFTRLVLSQPSILELFVGSLFQHAMLSSNALHMLGGVLEVARAPEITVPISVAIIKLFADVASIPHSSILEGFGMSAVAIIQVFSESRHTTHATKLIELLVRYGIDIPLCMQALPVAAVDFASDPTMVSLMVSHLSALTPKMLNVTSPDVVIGYVDFGSHLCVTSATLPIAFFEFSLQFLSEEHSHNRELLFSVLTVWNNVLRHKTNEKSLQVLVPELTRRLLCCIAAWAPQHNLSRITETLSFVCVRNYGHLVTSDLVALLPTVRLMQRADVDLFLGAFRTLSSDERNRRKFGSLMQDFAIFCRSKSMSNESLLGYHL